MTTMGEQVVAEVLADMRLHGFTKLRPTTHGMLYGFDRFRLSLPNNLKDKGHNSKLESLRKQWEALKSEMYGALPGLKQNVLAKLAGTDGMKPSEVDQMQPVEAYEDPPVPAVTNGHEPRFAPWTCPKCNQTFKHAGKHSLVCDGTQTVRGPNYAREQRAKVKAESKTQPKNEIDELLSKLKDLILKLERERNEAVRKFEKAKKSLA